MKLTVDAHVHAFPHFVKNDLAGLQAASGRVGQVRDAARLWWSPFSELLHRAQTYMRYLPPGARAALDEVTSFIPLPGLLIESTVTDLLHSMDQAGITHAAIIALPPRIPNDFVLEVGSSNPRLLPVVNLPKSSPRPSAEFKAFIKKGAKALKIHTAWDGETADSPRYRKLITIATDAGLPVILHTGVPHSHFFYKAPETGAVENFTPWFEEFPKTQFILAHMNYHEPMTAIDLAEKYLNLYLDTSWQPSEIIGEAARRLGAERILLGTDWPLIGNNLAVGLARLRECVHVGTLTPEQADQIQGLNAAKLLGIPHAPETQ